MILWQLWSCQRLSSCNAVSTYTSSGAPSTIRTPEAVPDAADEWRGYDPNMGIMGDKFEGVRLMGSTIFYKMDTYPIAGATARVELGGDIRKRVTATRFMALGIFSLAAKKQAGHVFLTVEGDGFDILVEVPVKKEAEARKFASKVNKAARG